MDNSHSSQGKYIQYAIMTSAWLTLPECTHHHLPISAYLVELAQVVAVDDGFDDVPVTQLLAEALLVDAFVCSRMAYSDRPYIWVR